MIQSEFLNMGTIATITGKITGRIFTGQLFRKDQADISAFPGRYFVIDVKELNGNQVKDLYSVTRVQDFSTDSMKGENFLVIGNRPIL